MSRNVFILGAGASAKAGVPLLKDFLQTANDLRVPTSLGAPTLDETDRAMFDLVFSARDELAAITSKSRLDFDNFEEIYSAFEMASLIGRLGNMEETQVRSLPRAMRRLITVTIERSMKLPVSAHSGGSQIMPPSPYDQFVKGIIPLIRRGEAAIITFNYDLAIDYALHFNTIPFDYGLDASATQSVDLLKLHGSLNWGRCSAPSCQKLEIWKLRDFLNQYRWTHFIDMSEVSLDLARKLASRTHCSPATLEEDPVLIPPTWNKGGLHQELSHVWRKAAAHLAQAENIYVVGYSFPASDQFFKYFFAVGSIGRGWIQKIRVMDPDTTGDVEQRFRGLFGPLALSKFRLIKTKFEDVAGGITSY